jgi:hypothetical protein
MNRSTVRTHRARNIALKFHLSQRALKICDRNRADYSVTFVANDLSHIAATDAKQTTAAIGIAAI